MESPTISDISHALLHDKVGIFPCDTLLGIIGCVTKTSIERIQRIKVRQDTPFIVLIPSIASLKTLCAPLSKQQQHWLHRYWPGPITFILPKHPEVNPAITCNRPTIAIRYPAFDPLSELFSHLKSPILSTSVNKSGDPAIPHPEKIPADFLSQFDFCYNQHLSEHNQASSIIDITTPKPTIIRQGAIQFEP